MGGWLLAHQGNWDEILMFLVPIAVAFGAVRWAERRSRKGGADREVASETMVTGRGEGGSPDDTEA